jgi:hypothetical protein
VTSFLLYNEMTELFKETMDNTERVLDWAPHHDPRSKAFPVAAVISTPPKRRNKLWKTGPVLDQGNEGACVGFGWTAEALSTPTVVDLSRVAVEVPREPTAFALDLYNKARRLDEWEGEDYDGTSVNAGAKAMRENGLVLEYRWAFSIDDVVDTILLKGPVVLGIEWRYGMYDAPNGVLKATGKVVGGHCITAVGYTLKSPKLGGEDGIILRNSWGADWGINGNAEIKVSELSDLLDNYGEAAVATRRSYGRTLPKK